jgi:predicted RNase H-like HicB family nuclease
MKYKVAIRKTEEGFSISCPGLPGCWSEGKTEQEALDNIADAISSYLDVAAELAGNDDAEMREIEIAA